MIIEEHHINATGHYGMSDPFRQPIEETILDGMTTGEMFKWFSKEYGRCIGKVCVDNIAGYPRAVGWVFQKKDYYEDTGEPFIHETWITLLDKYELNPPTVEFHELRR